MGTVINWGQRGRSWSRDDLLSCPHIPTLAFTHTLTHMHTHIHTPTHVHTRTHAMHKSTHEHRFVHASCLCTPVNFCPHTHPFSHTHTFMHTHLHTFRNKCYPRESCQLEEKECLFFCPLKYIPSFKIYLKCYLFWASPNSR